MRVSVVLVLATSLIVTACGQEAPSATPVPTATTSPTQTQYPSQTPTVEPTATPTSTSTETPVSYVAPTPPLFSEIDPLLLADPRSIDGLPVVLTAIDLVRVQGRISPLLTVRPVGGGSVLQIAGFDAFFQRTRWNSDSELTSCDWEFLSQSFAGEHWGYLYVYPNDFGDPRWESTLIIQLSGEWGGGENEAIVNAAWEEYISGLREDLPIYPSRRILGRTMCPQDRAQFMLHYPFLSRAHPVLPLEVSEATEYLPYEGTQRAVWRNYGVGASLNLNGWLGGDQQLEVFTVRPPGSFIQGILGCDSNLPGFQLVEIQPTNWGPVTFFEDLVYRNPVYLRFQSRGTGEMNQGQMMTSAGMYITTVPRSWYDWELFPVESLVFYQIPNQEVVCDP